jgi:hypothetical protein
MFFSPSTQPKKIEMLLAEVCLQFKRFSWRRLPQVMSLFQEKVLQTTTGLCKVNESMKCQIQSSSNE